MPTAAPPTRPPRGFTLLEVLVSIVVMASGVLGLLGMRLATLKHSANANARAIASVHAADIFDRLRANPVRAANGLYNIAIDASAPTQVKSIVDQDLQQWRRALTARLVDGTGSVSVSATGQAEVAVRWTERDTALEGPRTLTFTFRSQL